MKKLDKLIIKSFIGPFIAVFFITVFVLVMQFFWLWVDDFVGKGLDALTIMKFVWYQSAVLIPLALPLAVLLSSLMTFGNLGETFELVAIKSAGISLLRFMAPLFVVSALISVGAFLFSNYVIPVANLKSRTLLADIVLAKPAFNIKEGVFYDQLDGFSIKIGKKENDSIIKDIVVFEQGNNLQDNFIVAKNGIMKPSPDKHFLDFHLKNGTRYNERGSYSDSASEFIRMSFKEYKKQFDISSFNFKASADSNNRNNERVYSMRQLGKAIDSIGKENTEQKKNFRNNLLQAMGLLTYKDSITKEVIPDSVVMIKKGLKSIVNMIPDSARKIVNDRALGAISSSKTNIDMNLGSVEDRQKSLNRYQIEWHKKLALSLACLVLFLIGAPLGSIIRKGGLGSPLIFAIIFFLLFYFTSNTGEKFAKEGSWTPFSGMWFSTFILIPVGMFLTYKAMRDSNLFNKEFYSRVRKSILKRMGRE